MALTTNLLRHRPHLRPSLHRTFSSSDNPSNDATPPPPPTSSFSSYLSDVKASLSKQPPPRPPPKRQFSPSHNPNPPPKISSLGEIRKNLSQFRRLSAPPPPISFQDLYKKNVLPKSLEETKKNDFNAIRESLNVLIPKNQTSIGSKQFDNSFLKKPVSRLGFDRDQTLPSNIFGKEFEGKKGEGEGDGGVAKRRFFRMYGYEDLGKKLMNLRPAKKNDERNWFSLQELSERLRKLRDNDQKEEEEAPKTPFTDVKLSLQSIFIADMEKKANNNAEFNVHRIDMLNNLGAEQDFMLSPPKEHLVEKGYLQCGCCNILIKARLLSDSSTAICQSFYEHPIKEILADSIECRARTNKIDVLEHEISENDYITRLRLMHKLLNKGSLFDCKQLQAKILKVGFDSDVEICSRIFDVYASGGELCSALQGFDVLPCKNVSFWNNLVSGFVEKKAFPQVLALFSRIVKEGVEVDEDTFVYVLRACSGSKVDVRLVEQIHAKIIYHGCAKNRFVCNPLIDFYSRRGLINYAKHIFTGLCSRDSISWVAMISGFSRNGREEDGILLYKEMCSSGFIPTPYIFSSVLSASTKIEQYELGQQLHASIYKWQFSSEIFICNALVTLYLRCGKLMYADQIFSKMHSRDEVTYNALIAGFSQQGFSERSVQLFQQMQFDSLKPGCVTIASLLSACASLGALDSGRQLHSHATKAGMCSDIIIEGSLLDLYVKCSDLETARNFFLTTKTENIVLWNVMLGAYGQKGDLYQSYQMFVQMQSECLEPNQYTYPSILKTCTSVGALDLGEQIHTHVIKSGFQPNVYVCSVLIDMYSKNEKLDDALKILRRLTEKDVVSWTSMVAGYAQHDLFTEALKLIVEMQNQRIQLDNIGLSSAISACAGIQALKQGRQIHAQSIVSGYSWDVSIGNSLVCLYARCGKVQDAYLAFQKIDIKDKISWNGLISGFSQSGYCEEALKVFNQMNKVAVEADIFTYGSAVSAAANTTNVKQGKQIHAKIIKCGYNVEPEASNVLITLYAKCGSLSDALREFHEMPQKNVVSWNAMITGLSQHGCGHEAIELFQKMTRQGMTPNYVTFVSVLSACSHVGLVEEGLDYFKSMSDKHGLLPKSEHYACVVDILGRAGQLCRASKFVETMPIEPDAMIWRTLLSACTIHKNMEVGELAAHHLLQLEPQDSATYVLLSNMYAVSRKWEYRDQTRKLMKERGINKEPGRSWIEVKNNIHAFFVGDRLHPLATQIYQFLEDLNEKAATLGYVPDCNSLWNDMELGQKDPSTYVHSEKLAIAFGLLSLSEPIPLHVMKNLRVCNDCHNWIKFVSRISNRVIIVRDSYRFHHFEDGSCSCRDYW